MNLYVAPDGNDRWSGRLRAPDRRKSDGPFATLEAARDAIRALKKAGKLPEGGVTVWILGGVYPRQKTFLLTAEDGGTKSAPIIYRAVPKETVRLVGGREVKRWTPVNDPKVLARMEEAARGHVLQTDLKAQGIVEYGRMARRGFGQPIVPAGLELFFQDRPMPLARWPNGEEWARIAAVPAGQQGGRFTYEGDRPKRWTQAEDLWVHGYWTYDWADTYEKVNSIDTQKREIATEPPHGVYGYTAGKRFRALNLLEELDEPGEWYLDRAAGILYFWPPAPLSEGRAVVSLLEEPLVAMREVSHVALRGVTLECTRGMGVEITGGSGNLVAGCTIRNIGTVGVSIQNGTGHRVVSCDITECGDGGIQLSGGDRKTLTPAGHVALNNHIARYSRWSRTYRPAILINGVGNRAAHNRIHDAPHNAILMGGNEHLVEYNDIYRVCLQTGDAGAVYMGRDLTQRGIVIRYNYFHDITRRLEGSGGFIDVMAVYLDDCFCGTTVYGNLFYRAGRAAMIGGGRDNVIENNIFIECTPAIHVDARGLGWAKFWFDGRDSTLMDRLKEVNYNQPPYSTRYPHLANILEDEPAVAKYNRIVRNIRFGGGWIEWLDGMNEKIVEVKDNFIEGDPGFVAPEKGDFRLKPDAPALKMGFRPIPLEKIGLYKDEYRTKVPPRD